MSVLAFLLISISLMLAFIYSLVQFSNLKEVEVVVSNKKKEKELKKERRLYLVTAIIIFLTLIVFTIVNKEAVSKLYGIDTQSKKVLLTINSEAICKSFNKTKNECEINATYYGEDGGFVVIRKNGREVRINKDYIESIKDLETEKR